MQNDVFLDAAYAVALFSPIDTYHGRAAALADEMEQTRTQMITTRAVLLEIGNAFSKQRQRQAGVEILTTLEIDPNVVIVPLSEDIYARSLQLYCDRPDKEWGLTDCVSFLVMQDRGLSEALTTDRHFQQAGFIALMRE